MKAGETRLHVIWLRSSVPGFPRYLSSVMQATFRSLGQQYRGDVRYVLGISLHLQTGSRSFST